MFKLELPHKPDIIFSDVDGTLMDNNHVVTGTTIATLEKLISLSDKQNFALCTGRHPATLIGTVLPALEKLDPHALHVVCGGAMVIDARGEVLWKKVMAASKVKQICQQAENLGGSFGFGNGSNFFCGQEMLARRLTEMGGREGIIDFKSAQKIEKPEEWETALIVITNLNPELTAFLKNIAEQEGFNLTEMFSTRTGETYYDLTLPGIDKTTGIKKLLELKDMPTKAVFMLGDGMNDLAAVKEYFGIAVANAKEELKAVADLILPWTNDQEAVAKFLNLLLAQLSD